MLNEKTDWARALVSAERRWGIPPHVTASIIYQESSFVHNARPPAKASLLGVPVGRVSSAYGYAQVLDGTWKEYVEETGRWRAKRDKFASATDFIGWYSDRSYRINGVPLTDAYNLYLNYHDGWGGYRNGTYKSKPFLLDAAGKVERRAHKFEWQLGRCPERLATRSLLFPLF